MEIFKPEKPDHLDEMDADNPFYSYSHGSNYNGNDYSLCGVGSEEWQGETPRKRITCPECLSIIRHCKEYKF